MTSRRALQAFLQTSSSFRTKAAQNRNVLGISYLKPSCVCQARAMSFSAVSTENAPKAVGPYSQAIKAGNLVFVSGCVPLDPKTMSVAAGGIKEQATQALANMKAVVEASGSSVNQVAKCTVFLQDMKDFAAANEIYAAFFGDHRPARSCVEVARLPLDVLFEIECIAVVA